LILQYEHRHVHQLVAPTIAPTVLIAVLAIEDVVRVAVIPVMVVGEVTLVTMEPGREEGGETIEVTIDPFIVGGEGE